MTTKKWEITGFVGISVVAALVVYFTTLFICSWILMVLLGALHSYFSTIPALGYWPTFFITWLLFFIAGIFKSSSA